MRRLPGFVAGACVLAVASGCGVEGIGVAIAAGEVVAEERRMIEQLGGPEEYRAELERREREEQERMKREREEREGRLELLRSRDPERFDKLKRREAIGKGVGLTGIALVWLGLGPWGPEGEQEADPELLVLGTAAIVTGVVLYFQYSRYVDKETAKTALFFGPTGCALVCRF